MAIILHDLAGADPSLRFSPFCWRTMLALAHKGLAVETVPWRFREALTLPAPNQGRVPVIIDGARVVCDSLAIAEYLETTYPDRPSLFNGPTGHAGARFINGWADAVLISGIFPLIIADLFQSIDPGDQDYFRKTREGWLGTTMDAAQAGREHRVAAFRASLAPLRTVLATHSWLSGAAPGYADYIIAGSLMWPHCVSRFELLAEDDPIHAWFGRMFGLYDGMLGAAKRA